MASLLMDPTEPPRRTPWAGVVVLGDRIKAVAGPGSESWVHLQILRNNPTTILPFDWGES